MCGIAGVIDLQINKNKSNNNNCELVQKMLNNIHHRGPDESGILNVNGYAVGAVRLTMLGDKQGKQPLKNDKSVLIFNGEIYNYKNIAKDYLGDISGIKSDSYALFKFLNRHSLKKINLLNGMFSFCYIDENDIYLVRDRFGEKPLYYTIKNNRLFFASEIKAFSGIIDLKINLPEFYFYLEIPLVGETIFNDIFEVKPSTYIRINRRNYNISTHQYFSIFDIQTEEGSEGYLKDKLRWLVEDSIKIRIDTSLQYGVFISGGLDSSILALLTKPDVLLTYLPQSKLIDSEEAYADTIAALLPKSRYTKVSSSEGNFLNELIQTVYFNGGPTTTLAALSQYRLSKVLQSKNMRLAFSGLGIDEFFNGYIRHALSLIPQEYFDKKDFFSYKSLVEKINIKHPSSLIYASLLNRSEKVNRKFIQSISTLFDRINSKSASISICDAFFTLPPLLHTDDHLNMAFGIESRAPFLDYRLVSFALGLPTHMKIKIDSQKSKVYLKYLLVKIPCA